MVKNKDTDVVDTSDDDYIDPSVEKYFKSGKASKKQADGKKGKNGASASAASAVIADKEEKPKSEKKKWSMDDSDDEEDLSDYEEEEPSELEDSDNDDDNEDDDGEKDDANGDENGENGEDQDGEESDHRKKLTKKIIDSWAEKLRQDKPFGTINEVVKAFKASLLNVVPGKKSLESGYRVEGSELFNAMVRLCIKDLLPCLLRLLKLNVQTKASKNENGLDTSKVRLANSGNFWKKLKAPIKSYLADVLLLATNIIEPDILNVLLRHMRVMLNFYLCFPKILKQLIKLLIKVWSQSDEKSRVIAFVCLHKITANSHDINQDFIFKNLYLSFARNSKFTSINTLPSINFMQRSLIEIYAANTKLAYEHVFVYIRQLAIHLRNAMMLKKKESYQVVYNWQYVHSLILWSKFLGLHSNSNENLQSLIYPLVQCMNGTIQLVPTPRYYPLRFHCLNALINLSNATEVFIPIIPHVLEVFDITNFNKKHATISSKQVQFSFILKLAKQQLIDKSFKDTLIDIIYDNLILYLQNNSHDIAFPELVLPLAIRLRDFVKKCKNANYCKVMKGLLDKVDENVKFIEERRSKATFSLRDKKEVDMWMKKTKEQGTPLSQWYKRYKVMREREIMMEISNKEHISKNQVPVAEPPTRQVKDEERKEFEGLFVNLSDDDSDTEFLDFTPKKKNGESADDKKNGEEEQQEEEDDDEDFQNPDDSEDSDMDQE